jgi:Rrf2 family cysteine metabolism transcriptional repressor
VLAKEPGEISLRDILQALEGSWSLVDCLDDDRLCDRAKECVTYEIWHDIQTSIYRILDSTTLPDMINRHRKKAET